MTEMKSPESGSDSRVVRAKVWLCLAGAIVLVAVAAVWFWAKPLSVPRDRVYRIGFENSPPFQIVNADGKEGGTTVEIIKRAADRLGLKLEWVRCFGGPDLNLTSGAIDLWPMVGDLPARRTTMYITKPWSSCQGWMVTRAENPVRKPADLAGRAVWHVDDRPSRAYAEMNFSGAKLIGKADGAAVLAGVRSGAAEAGFVWGSRTTAAKQENGGTAAGEGLVFQPLPKGMLMFGMAAALAQPDARRAADALVEEIGRMSDEGVIASVYLAAFLDSGNEVDVVRYQQAMHRRSVLLLAGIGALAWFASMLVFQTVRLRRARRAALAAGRAKSEFLANMSHEIRTPLNSVIGMTELALASPLTAQQREYLSVSLQSADTLLSLVNDVLDFSRIEAGAMKLNLVPVDLEDLVEGAARAFAHRAHQKHLELLVEVSPECPQYVQADAARLKQVIFNLLSNAVKFTEHGEIELRVAAETREGAPWLRFSVVDTGIGVPRGAEKLLFEPFSQVDGSTTRKFGGTGLGLVISRRLVGFMGGRIWHADTPGGGAIFHFSIPAITAEVPVLCLPHGGPNRLQGVRVLVVDDNKKCRDQLESRLQTEGAKTRAASSVGEALAVLADGAGSAEPFSVILLDGFMPGQDSLSLVAALSKNEEAGASAVIWMLTADDSDTLAKGRQFGVSAYVYKPVFRDELIETVMRASGKSTGTTTSGLIRVQPEEPNAAPQVRLRVLVAEDNQVNQKVMHALLSRHGHEIVMAENGRQAVDYCRSMKFDVIFMDVQMPVMDGLEATEAIRALEAGTKRHVPIVAMTACAMKEDQEQCLGAGMDGYMSKPISARKIAEFLDALLAKIDRSRKKKTPPEEPGRAGEGRLPV